MTSFEKLVSIMQKLRGPDGCPWDKEQTHLSIIPNLKEETDELIEAIRSGDKKHFKEELGDVLLQVVFHAQIASENGDFDINDVINEIADKLTRRHPHVFGNKKAKTAQEALQIWKSEKKKEKLNSKKRK